MLRAHSVSCNQAPCKVHAKLYVPVLGTNTHINKDELSTFPLGPRESLCLRSKNHLSRIMRKPTFCMCENKDADQLWRKLQADQRLCFHYIDSTIPLLSKS